MLGLIGLIGLMVTGVVMAVTSPSGTVVIAPSTGLITTAAGDTWGISAAACTAPFTTGTGVILVNGKADATTCSVVELAYVSGLVWQKNVAGNWFSKTGPTAGWVGPTTVSPIPVVVTPPPPTFKAAALITWTAPTLNTDGSTIAGPLTYNVYRACLAGTATPTAGLTKLTSVTGVTFTDPAGSVTPSTCTYAISAVNAAAAESGLSNTFTTTIAAVAVKPGTPVQTSK